jgi:hypothetical protein
MKLDIGDGNGTVPLEDVRVVLEAGRVGHVAGGDSGVIPEAGRVLPSVVRVFPEAGRVLLFCY